MKLGWRAGLSIFLFALLVRLAATGVAGFSNPGFGDAGRYLFAASELVADRPLPGPDRAVLLPAAGLPRLSRRRHARPPRPGSLGQGRQCRPRRPAPSCSSRALRVGSSGAGRSRSPPESVGGGPPELRPALDRRPERAALPRLPAVVGPLPAVGGRRAVLDRRARGRGAARPRGADPAVGARAGAAPGRAPLRPAVARGARLRVAADALAGLVLALAPWTVRNAARFHELIPVSDAGGVSLYAGNSAWTRSFYALRSREEYGRWLEDFDRDLRERLATIERGGGRLARPALRRLRAHGDRGGPRRSGCEPAPAGAEGLALGAALPHAVVLAAARRRGDRRCSTSALRLRGARPRSGRPAAASPPSASPCFSSACSRTSCSRSSGGTACRTGTRCSSSTASSEPGGDDRGGPALRAHGSASPRRAVRPPVAARDRPGSPAPALAAAAHGRRVRLRKRRARHGARFSTGSISSPERAACSTSAAARARWSTRSAGAFRRAAATSASTSTRRRSAGAAGTGRTRPGSRSSSRRSPRRTAPPRARPCRPTAFPSPTARPTSFSSSRSSRTCSRTTPATTSPRHGACCARAARRSSRRSSSRPRSRRRCAPFRSPRRRACASARARGPRPPSPGRRTRFTEAIEEAGLRLQWHSPGFYPGREFLTAQDVLLLGH